VCFNCCDSEGFCRALESLGRRQVLLNGIEAHICVYQTGMALARAGYEVQVVSDCISSRNVESKAVALSRMGASGVSLTTAEMALFELLKVGQGEKFKQISAIVK
jgi:nicotinamidase-related amidase